MTLNIVARARRQGRAVLPTAITTYSGYALSLISAPLIATALGAEGRGILAAALVPLQILSWAAFLGIPRGATVASKDGPGVSWASVAILTALGLAAAVVAYISAPVFANDNSLALAFLRLASLLLPLTGVMQLGSDLLLAAGRLVAWNAIRACTLIFPSIAIIAAAALDRLTLASAFSIQLGGVALAILVGITFALRSAVANGPGIPWRFSLRFWTSSAFDSVAARVDQLVLAAFAPFAELGVYAVAVTCASVAGGATQALADASFSHFFSGGSGPDEKALKARSQLGLLVSAVVSVAVIALVAAFGGLLFGEDFGGLTLVVAVLCVYQALGDQWRFRSYYDSAQGRSRELMYSSGVALAVFLGAVVVVAATTGVHALGVSIAMVMMALARLAAHRVLSRSRTNPFASEPTAV